MSEQGYKIRFSGEGEAVVLKPDKKTVYFVSLTGVTYTCGCTCLGFQVHGRCKHLTVVAANRPCDAPACTSIQAYQEYKTTGGPISVFECIICRKTTDLRLVYMQFSKRRSIPSAA
jgi:hypothetical protein